MLGAQLHETGHRAERGVQRRQPVLADIQIREPVQGAERFRQFGEPVVVQIQETAQAGEAAEFRRDRGEQVVPEVEGVQTRQRADAFGKVCEPIVGQQQHLKGGMPPHLLGYDVQAAPPVVEHRPAHEPAP